MRDVLDQVDIFVTTTGNKDIIMVRHIHASLQHCGRQSCSSQKRHCKLLPLSVSLR